LKEKTMNGYCWYGNAKGRDALYRGDALELPDGTIRCRCGRKLKKSNAGFGAGWTIPRHKKPKGEDR
jgi:hypothetical protein